MQEVEPHVDERQISEASQELSVLDEDKTDLDLLFSSNVDN
jgi:hypothetical protein